MQNCAISADSLGQMLESFLADAPHAVALENGEPLFDFSTARYSVSGEGKCVLHLWSDERNAVRRVLDAELKPRVLRLSVLRFGQSQPTVLEISADRDQRSATALRAIRARYRQVFERVLLREFPATSSTPSATAPTSNIPAARCTPAACCARASRPLPSSASAPTKPSPPSMPLSPSAFSGCIASASSLPVAPMSQDSKLFAPAGRSEMLRQRMAHLNRDAAKWQLYELDERAETCAPLDCNDSGNIVTRLVRAVDADCRSRPFRRLHRAHASHRARLRNPCRIRQRDRLPPARPRIRPRQARARRRLIPQ